MGPSGGLMLDGDLLAYSSMAISLFSGLFLVAIHMPRTPFISEARWKADAHLR